jgi:hypothetical protein
MGEPLPAGTETPYGVLTGGRLRVLTWNVWWRFGSWEERQPAIAATIERLDPDIVCLQETWPEAVEALAASLGLHQVYASRIDFDGVPFGNAVLARWPLTRSCRCRPRPSSTSTGPACAPTSTIPTTPTVRSRCSAPT